LRASEFLGGLRSRKEKTIKTPPIFGQKIKKKINEVLKNLSFFAYQSIKLAL
jgi:hypothetical protein